MSQRNIAGPFYGTDGRGEGLSQDVRFFVQAEMRTEPSIPYAPGLRTGRGDDRSRAPGAVPAAGPDGDGGTSCFFKENVSRTYSAPSVRNYRKGLDRAKRGTLCFSLRPSEETSSAIPMLRPRRTQTAGIAAICRRNSISIFQEKRICKK